MLDSRGATNLLNLLLVHIEKANCLGQIVSAFFDWSPKVPFDARWLFRFFTACFRLHNYIRNIGVSKINFKRVKVRPANHYIEALFHFRALTFPDRLGGELLACPYLLTGMSATLLRPFSRPFSLPFQTFSARLEWSMGGPSTSLRSAQDDTRGRGAANFECAISGRTIYGEAGVAALAPRPL